MIKNHKANSERFRQANQSSGCNIHLMLAEFGQQQLYVKYLLSVSEA